MHYTHYTYGWGPGSTSSKLLFLMGCLAAISLSSALIDGLLVYYFGIYGPQAFLSLSWSGLSQWYIWQPLSYLFVFAAGNAGLSMGFFFELAFSLYILWIMGSTLISRLGESPFFRFYFICGIAAGLLTLFCMPLIRQFTTLSGPAAPIMGIITVWTMLLPESELLLFFLIPVKAKWLFSSLFSMFLLINLSHLNFIGIIFDLFSVLISYFYATVVWELQSPFPIFNRVDRFLNDLGVKIRRLKIWKSIGSPPAHPLADKEAKIYDFHTGSPVLSDDAFMDFALEKISRQGEQSLTWSERARMKKISESKARRRNS